MRRKVSSHGRIGVINPIVKIAHRRRVRAFLSLRLWIHKLGRISKWRLRAGKIYPSSCRRPLTWRSMRKSAICSEISPNMKMITEVVKANTDMLVKRFCVT